MLRAMCGVGLAADEWWLMVEAKKRNPDIKLFTLAWTAPGWIGDGTRGPESQGGYYSQDNIKYHLNWIKGAKETHNLTLDYMGVRRLLPFKSSDATPYDCSSHACLSASICYLPLLDARPTKTIRCPS